MGNHPCIILIIITTLGILTNGKEWPLMLVKEGDSGVIPCIPRGQATTFFWKRGKWYNVSNEIAYNVNGQAGPDSEKFYVFNNGSLLLRNMTVMDEGNYHCRIASDRSECHGSVTIYLKASNTNKLPYIDRCSPNKGCTVYGKPSSTVSLTCIANQVSSDMTLKWFNDSNQITDDVEESKNENDMNETIISSTIKVRYDGPHSLTCQASGMKMENSFAHVQLQSEHVCRTSAGIIVVTVVLGAVCFVLLGFAIYTLVVKRSRKRRKKLDSERADGADVSLIENSKDLNAQLEKVKEDLSKEKNRTQELEIKLQSSERELKELERQQLQQNITNQHGEGKELTETIANVMRQLEEKDKKIQKAEADLRSKSDQLKLSIGELKTAKTEVKSLESQLQAKEDKIKSLRGKLQAKDDKLESFGGQLQAKEDELELTKDTLKTTRTALEVEKANVKERESKLKLFHQELEKTKKEVKAEAALLQEIKWSWKEHEISQRNLRKDVLQVTDSCMTLCRTKTGSRNTDARRKGENTIKIFGDNYHYNSVLSLNATRREVFLHLDDLIQNGIDGGNAMIFLHGNSGYENFGLMFDKQNEGGIIPRAIKRMFQVSKLLENVELHMNVTGIFANTCSDDQTKLLFTPPSDKEAEHESGDEGRVAVPTEEKAMKLLQMHIKEQKFTNNFVQFSVKTTYENEDLTSGRITFCSFNDMETMKKCLRQVKDEGSAFVRYLTSVLRAEANLAILTNINEDDKETAKIHLKFSQWINKEKEENRIKSLYRKITGTS